jgi:hypothetical protein
MDHPQLFQEHFEEGFQKISKDPVVNVRMTLAESLATYLYKDSSPLRYDPKVQSVCQALKYDVKDVSDYLLDFNLETESDELMALSREVT